MARRKKKLAADTKALKEAIDDDNRDGARPIGSVVNSGNIHLPAAKLSTVIEKMDSFGQFETLNDRTPENMRRNAMKRMKTLKRKGLVNFYKTKLGAENV